jgi:hypothetical protein
MQMDLGFSIEGALVQRSSLTAHIAGTDIHEAETFRVANGIKCGS